MDVTVAISTFGRHERVVETVSNLSGVPALVNVNDADLALAARLRETTVRVVVADQPQLFWEGMVALVQNVTTEWMLITSDEDPLVTVELDGLVRFAEERSAGVVASPVWDNDLVKPWPQSWANRLNDDSPLHPRHFHDISGYISGTLLHRPTALKHLPLIERLAPTNDYVCLYTVPALVALIGIDRPSFVYGRQVVRKGPELPGQTGVRGSGYWEPASRRRQHEHHLQFLDAACEVDAEYGALLREARVYEQRPGWG